MSCCNQASSAIPPHVIGKARPLKLDLLFAPKSNEVRWTNHTTNCVEDYYLMLSNIPPQYLNENNLCKPWSIFEADTRYAILFVVARALYYNDVES